MTLPRHPAKLDAASVVTPTRSLEHYLDDVPASPDSVILCFHDGLFEHVAEAYETIPFGRFGDGLAIDATGGTLGVLRVPGVGAPTAALAMENLIAGGSQRFVIVGFAGGLQPDLDLGDAVLVEHAIRDEGTSYHYLEPDVPVAADDALRGTLGAALDAADTDYASGTTWTTDAPYRETATEIERYRDDGVMTVDMEAAAVFAVAAYRNVTAGAAFTVSDRLDVDGWSPGFTDTAGDLERLLDDVIGGLSHEDRS